MKAVLLIATICLIPSAFAGDCAIPSFSYPQQSMIEGLKNRIQTDCQCQLSPRVKTDLQDGKTHGLTSFWAQEYTGLDLARELASKQTLASPSVVIVDANHAPNLTNMRHGDHVQSIVEQSGNFSLSYADVDGGKVGLELDILRSLDKNPPAIINNSMGWESYLAQQYSQLSNEGSVVVTAAGNDTSPVSKAQPEKSEAALHGNIIIVASTSPEGGSGNLSNSGEAVTISAPADDALLSGVKTGDTYHAFGDTSGAAPQVTGALANFEAISGYRLSPAEAKSLVISTATPKTFRGLYGAGTLNAYKMAVVAQKLKAACSGQSDCIRSALQNPATYQFTPDSQATSQARAAFPDCAHEGKKAAAREPSCSTQQSALEALRQEALLNPQDTASWSLLGCIYEKEGYGRNASFYYGVASAEGDPTAFKKAVTALEKEASPDHAADFIFKVGNGDVLKTIQSLNPDKTLKESIYSTLFFNRMIDSASRAQLVAQGLKDSDEVVRVSSIKALELDSASSESLNALYRNDHSGYTRAMIIQKVCHSPLDGAQTILKQASSDSSADNRSRARACLGN